jgi:hypothetical protein
MPNNPNELYVVFMSWAGSTVDIRLSRSPDGAIRAARELMAQGLLEDFLPGGPKGEDDITVEDAHDCLVDNGELLVAWAEAPNERGADPYYVMTRDEANLLIEKRIIEK